MSNHISHASLPYPVKNARFTVVVPFLDADGDPTDPTTPDTEVSQDGGAFADAAEEVTTISGSNGLGFVTLTGAEMNNSAVGVCFKAASGPKATLMTLSPRVLPLIESGTAQAGAAGTITLAAGAAAYDLTGCIIRTTGGTGGGGTGGANNQARVITAYNTSTKVATVVPNWETTPGATTTYDILRTENCGSIASIDMTQSEWNNLVTDTHTTIPGRLPAALVGGKIDANIGSVTAGVIAAASFAANALDAVWSTATRVLTAATNLTTALATPTNITAGTITTVTNLTNAPSDSSGVTTLLSRIPSGIFIGITSLAQWLGLLAGKQTGNTTARTELRATGGGSGTFDETTDSQEALRDRGDASWITGSSPLDASGVRAAVGLASANLDTQLDPLPTNAELATVLGNSDDAVLAALAAFPLKRNTAGQHVNFYLRDSSDPTTGKTGACTVTVSIDGAAFAPTTGTVTQLGSGVCDFAPSAADLNGTQIVFMATLTGGVPVVKEFFTHA